MPTYEYLCPKGHRFDRFQKMTDEPRAECPECGEESQRVISGGAGFLFKGNGFYITDYRSDSYKKEAEKEKGVKKPPAAKEASKSAKDAPAPTKSSAKASGPAESGS